MPCWAVLIQAVLTSYQILYIDNYSLNEKLVSFLFSLVFESQPFGAEVGTEQDKQTLSHWPTALMPSKDSFLKQKQSLTEHQAGIRT